MIDELRGWGLDPPVVLGDSAYGDITELRLGLEARGIDYVLDVKGATSALPETAMPERPNYAGSGRSPAARYRRPFGSLAKLAQLAGEHAVQQVRWRGTRGRMSSRFLALRVRPANVKLRRPDPDGRFVPTASAAARARAAAPRSRARHDRRAHHVLVPARAARLRRLGWFVQG